MKTPFEIGDTYFLPKTSPTQVKIPCPICAGKKVVTVIDGYGVTWEVDCEGCGLGFEQSRGFINEYSYAPSATSFVIREIRSFYDGRWSVISITGEYADYNVLHKDYGEALDASTKSIEKLIEENHRRTATHKADMLKKKGWTLRYHQECIDKFDRQKSYHLRKIRLIKAQSHENG